MKNNFVNEQNLKDSKIQVYCNKFVFGKELAKRQQKILCGPQLYTEQTLLFWRTLVFFVGPLISLLCLLGFKVRVNLWVLPCSAVEWVQKRSLLANGKSPNGTLIEVFEGSSIVEKRFLIAMKFKAMLLNIYRNYEEDKLKLKLIAAE